MVNIVIIAPKGHMGRLITEAAYERSDITVAGGVGRPGSDYIGKDVGDAAGLGRKIGAQVYDDLEKIVDKCDVVVDFSAVEVSMANLEICLAHGKAFICGTTGFNDEQAEKLMAAGRYIPMMKAANTSFVVNVMRRLLAQASQMLGDKCEIEIIEMHSRDKLDAPSGTAIEMACDMADSSDDKTYEDIKFHSVRAGNTPSTHRVIFGCMGEKLEISHDAYDWRCYAEGACDAAIFMAAKPAGLYTMEDVIGI